MSTAVSSRRLATIGVIGALTLQFVASATAGPIALPGCPENCGGVQVPYPFGIGRGCFHEGFNLTCDEAQHPAKLLLGDGVEVLDISLPDCTVRIQTKISWVEYAAEFNGSWSVPAPDGPLMVSTARNSFVAFGCNVLAKLIPYGTVLSYASACAAACVNTPDVSSCSGVGCCQTSIASLGSDLPWYGIQVKHLEGETGNYYHRAVFIVDQDWFSRVEAAMASNFSALFFGNRFHEKVVMVDSVPVVLEWSLDLIRDAGLFVLSPIGPQSSDFRCLSSNSFSYTIIGNYDRRRCNCSHGYEGNPYIADGCQGTEVLIKARISLVIFSTVSGCTSTTQSKLCASSLWFWSSFSPILQILTSASCQIFTHVMEPASLCLGHTDAHQRKASGAFQVQNTTASNKKIWSLFRHTCILLNFK